jgi:uncharacterized damage-inducible protein DinB
MRMRIVVLALAVLSSTPLYADGTFKTEWLKNFDDTSDKIVKLAQAVPADKYGWRPGAGVRSMGEVFMHVSLNAYAAPTPFGGKPPIAVKREMETEVTKKDEIVDHLKKSFAYWRASVDAMPEADLEKMIQGRSGPRTGRSALLATLTHLHEHLGQSIAYARMNGVVPPWSETPAK